jgi:GNAT superfamily N-acetyltransferase
MAAMHPKLERARQLLHLARMRGLRRTLRAGVQAWVWSSRSWYIFYRPVPDEPVRPPSDDFVCKLAGPEDVESLAVFEPLGRHRREFREWIGEGSYIFVAYKDGRPVSFQRVSRRVPAGPPLSSLALAPGQVWGADAQTLPDFRGQHVGAALREFRDRTLRARGVREYVSSVQSDNHRALILGYGGRQRLVERVERLDYRCRFGVRRIQRVRDALPALEGVLAQAGLLPASRG